MKSYHPWSFGPLLLLIGGGISILEGDDRSPSLNAAESRIEMADDAPQPMTPADSVAQVRMPSGFKMSLVASEPLVQDPSGVAFDEWGRLYVSELHGYNIEGHLDVQELNKTGQLDETVRRIRWEFMGGKIAEQAAKLQFGVIKLLSDRDGDGVMDHAEVWADDLPPCYGLLAARGGVIAVCAPDIVFLTDRNHDGKVDFRETLFTGFRVRTLERGINNPRWGIDNWIYVGGGGEGGTITGPHLRGAVELGGTDFRIKADGTAIEPVTGRVGTFGMTMNSVGDRFPSSGGTPAIYALPIPYRYLMRNPFVPSPSMNHRASDYYRGFRISQPHPWRVRRQKDPAWVKFYGTRETDSNYFSGGCSGEFYGGGAFPRDFTGSLFYCEPSMNMVHRTVIERAGNGYTARRAASEQSSEFLASTDQWFRPMSLRLGPDGDLYIVDMYREIIEDYSAIPRFLQQQYGLNRGSDFGRIWRLSPPRESANISSLGKETMASLPGERLVHLTQDSEKWVRQTAQRLLVERQDETVVDSLRSVLRQGQSASGSLAALYTLDGLGALDRDSVLAAMKSGHSEVRIHGARLGERWGADRGIQGQLLSMIRDSDSRVRLQLALSLGEVEDSVSSRGLLDLARHYPDDRWMPAAILCSAKNVATPLLLGLLREPKLFEEAQAMMQPLAATVSGLGTEAQVKEILTAAFARDPESQVLCLDGILEGGLGFLEDDKVVGGDWPILEMLLVSGSDRVQERCVRLISRMPGVDRRHVDALLATAVESAQDREAADSERFHSLRLLQSAPFELVESLAAQLIVPAESPGIQRAALETLSASRDGRTGTILLAGWEGYSPEIREAVMGVIFSREDRLPALVDAMEDGRLTLNALSETRRERLGTVRDPDLAARAKSLVQETTVGLAQAKLEEFQAALSKPRNVERGKQVFSNVCAECHQAEGLGFSVGPALGSISGKPDEALLLDLLTPSDKVDPEYRSYTIDTREGESFTGVLSADSPTSVTLRAAKGVEAVILRRDIELFRSSELSLMPSNLSELLSPAEVADLLAYLRVAFAEK